MRHAELGARLRALGLRDVDDVRIHHNRVVMLSLRRRILRLHAGYADAPDAVLLAIVRYLKPFARRTTRAAARREFLSFPVEQFAPVRPRRPRSRRVLPSDLPWLRKLEEAHARLNATHFGGVLSPVPIRISGRMRRRLGEVSVHRETGRVEEMAFNRRHLRRDPWEEVERTVLHELVHQWQAENGLPVDHRAGFRRKAREVGLPPARVVLRPDVDRGGGSDGIDLCDRAARS